MTDNAFSRSVVDGDQIAAWQDADGIAEAEPMGVNIVNGALPDGTQLDLTLFGIVPGGFLTPEVSEGKTVGQVDGIVVSEPLKEAGVEIGTVITLDRSDVEFIVVGFTQGQSTFGHVDVAFLPVDTWRLLAAGQTEPGAPTQEQVDALDFEYASVVALHADDGADPGYEALDAAAGTMHMTLTEAFNASPGYEAETLTIGLGLIGAAIAVIRIVRIDPLRALGGQR